MVAACQVIPTVGRHSVYSEHRKSGGEEQQVKV